jgi:hypothetical protein
MNFLSKASEDRDPSNSAHQIKPAWCSPENPCSEALREKERMLQELRMRYDILYSLHQDVLSLLIDLKTKPKAQGAVFPSLDVVNEIVDREVVQVHLRQGKADRPGQLDHVAAKMHCERLQSDRAAGELHSTNNEAGELEDYSRRHSSHRFGSA